MSRAEALIDVGAIERNCALLRRRLTPGASLCAVVKADGYGHGADRAAHAAVAGGAGYLAVASAAEAAELRREMPERRILTMGALSPGELEVALLADSEVSVWTPGFLDLVRRREQELNVEVSLHVKFDSGMGRLGTRDPEVAVDLCRRIGMRDGLVGLWTHYATADEDDPGYLIQQVEAFSRVVETASSSVRPQLVHASNSAATLRPEAPDFDMVRCGIAIYGLDPFQKDPRPHGLEPALTLRSYVAAVKRFGAGDSAGYGRKWSAPSDTWVAVLPIGYADGVRRALSNRGEVLIGGRRHKMVGTVSMDNITVELGPDTDVAVGDEAVLIGAQGDERILCEELAGWAGTINYEIATGIGPRVPRRDVRFRAGQA